MKNDEVSGSGQCGGPSERALKVFETRKPVFTESGDVINAIKHNAANLWDVIDNISIPPGNTEAGRLVSIAKTELETSVMYAVKAVSRT